MWRRSDRTGCPESIARSGPEYCITISSNVRRMSSIIACSSPGTSGANGTRCGVLPRSLIPSACANRLAGSIVKTTTVRPYSAARNASAAAVVVLPTPPAPQHTTTRLDVSARIAPISRVFGVTLIEPPAGQVIPRARRGCQGRRRQRPSAIPIAEPARRQAVVRFRRVR